MTINRFLIVLALLAPVANAQDVTFSDTDTSAYDKHDFSGLWSRAPDISGQPPCPECRDTLIFPNYGFHGEPPPRTAEGQRRFDLNKPARGLELGSAAATARPELDIGFRRAILPAFGNDPEMRCEPLGLPRLITFAGGGGVAAAVDHEDDEAHSYRSLPKRAEAFWPPKPKPLISTRSID